MDLVVSQGSGGPPELLLQLLVAAKVMRDLKYLKSQLLGQFLIFGVS